MSPINNISVPDEWDVKSLWSVAPRVKESGEPDAQPLSVYLNDGVVPRSSREDNHNQLGENLSSYLVVRPGDLVFNKLRTWQGGLGVSEYHGIVSPAYFVCRPTGVVFPKYLHYLLRSNVYLAELTRVSKWMPPSQFDIPWEQLKKLPVLLPSIDKQRIIAEFLDYEVGRISRLVIARRSQLQAFDERESSLISERFIPGSVDKAAGEFPWPWLPRMSACVPLVRLGYICQVQGGVTVDASRDPSATDVTRPYLRVANVKADRLELSSVTEITVPKAVADRSTLQPGDVLVTEGGDIDKLGRGTVWGGELPGALHQNHVFALRPDPEQLDAEYLALLTRSVHGRCYFESTGVKSTNLASTSSSKVRSFPIPLVPLAEQRKAVAEVHRSLAEVVRLRAALKRQIDLLEERKRALITAAVTGQIDVTTARGADVS